jgi:hypothetical protein
LAHICDWHARFPITDRSGWRRRSKWGFADLDNLTVEADKLTLTPEDFAKITDLLKLRPIQFCIFLEGLVGADEMVRMMVEAITVAKKV